MRIIFLFFAFSVFGLSAQKNLRDSTARNLLIGINYKASFSGADLADRWGFNNQIGLSFDYKFKNNFTVGISSGFIFGSNLRDSTIFDGIYNSYGTITSLGGNPADVFFLMRGLTIDASVGYVFNRFGNNVNSGLWVKFGAGFLGHKIRVEKLLDAVPQLEGDYVKGYDKLTQGFATRQFIGYLYQADVRLIKFYAGFEFVQGFTKNVRTYNFDTGGPNYESRLDLMSGFKIGWIIPIGHRERSEYYY